MTTSSQTFDFVVIGSGFGGSVSAMRLTEKGYRVLVLERGKRFRDEDFARTSWDLRRYVWMPLARCFGILQISPFKDVIVLHGSGVGGGSLGYANVLEVPTDELFSSPAWHHLADWKTILMPHYQTARRMLGVAPNPKLWPADFVLKQIAKELAQEHTFRPTTVGEVEIEVGTRVPAWRLAPPIADFGTVFWEVFTPRAKRKLFGSEARNRKGDWDVQLYPTSPETIWANLDLAERYDASRPIGIY